MYSLNEYNESILERVDECSLLDMFINAMKHHSDELDSFDHVDDKSIRESAIYIALAGSRSFNLDIETSDQDFTAVRQASINSVLSIDGPKEIVHHLKPDISIYELRHYAKLLLLGNPKQVESLFTTRLCYLSDHWKALLQCRQAILSNVVIDHYYSTIKALVGDVTDIINSREVVDSSVDQSNIKSKPMSAKQQRMVEKNKLQRVLQHQEQRDDEYKLNKRAYHALRLMIEVERLLDNGTPLVWFEDGPERDLLLQVRRGDIDDQQILKLIQPRFQSLEETWTRQRQSPNYHLKDTSDIEKVSNWLVLIRRQSIDSDTSERFTYRPNTTTTTTPQPLMLANQLLQSSGVNGTLLFMSKVGSHLYNLNNNNADDNSSSSIHDWIGIYAAPTDQVVSLFPPPIKVEQMNGVTLSKEWVARDLSTPPKPQPQPTKDITTKGIILYEVSNAIECIMRGNYRLLECFLTEQDKATSDTLYETDAWMAIKEPIRRLITGRHLAQSYWGVGQNEYLKARDTLGMKKLHQGKKKPKGYTLDNVDNIDHSTVTKQQLDEVSINLYFALRLLWQCEKVLDGQSRPSLALEYRDEKRQTLLSLKNQLMSHSIDNIQVLMGSCRLLIESTNDRLEILRVEQRSDHLAGEFKSLFNQWLIKVRKGL
ncbi:hypothetical protein SAMD00019534_095530 [Acytostelium subglobosum LB1]|uniref:hypothetical protein n=1 Tax=Acytostelium subglobosum LB1 TaxID=1410327 RepID=UPI0006451D5D|nr:hypothetical protein SAMD00019534_095530 [Acytostelium subglobosum LB1]GAM26378.1 hypothetical protein SAMD00019534_095530 [Acytostelium subglobosum LB1]|eukprot:XP_012750474.1 hypothetical protein SAMD00019534_095530 [Acytostelium subglobosum LB1]